MGWMDRKNYDLEKGDFAWCLHCECAFIFDRPDVCPSEDCDGNMKDFSAWEDFRQCHGDEVVPVVGKKYPLYR